MIFRKSETDSIQSKSERKVKGKSLSRVRLFATPWTTQSMEFSSPEYWSGQPFPSPGVFPTQGLNPGLPHCRWILYQLSHKGSLFLNQALLCLCFFFLIQSIFLKILNLGSWDKNKAPHIEIFYNRELLPFLSLGRKQAKILCYVQDFETEHLRACK